MQVIWNRIETQLHRLASEVKEHLRPGASEATLRQVEAWIPAELPEEAKAVYRIHDGQAEPTRGRVDDFSLFSFLGIETPEEVKAFYHRPDVPTRCTGVLVDGWSFFSLKRLCYSWLIQRNDLGLPVSTSNPPVAWPTLECAPVLWHPKWLPFMGHLTGAKYCIDLAPGPHGRMGQILLYNDRYHEYPGPPGQTPFLQVVAPGIQDFFLTLANDLEAGRYAFDEATGMLWSKEMLPTLTQDDLDILKQERERPQHRPFSVDDDLNWDDLSREHPLWGEEPLIALDGSLDLPQDEYSF